jgi:hypothetical protein
MNILAMLDAIERWVTIITSAGAVAELADAADLKSAGGDTLWVQVPPAPQVAFYGNFRLTPPYMGAFSVKYFIKSPLCVNFIKHIQDF